MMGTDECNHCSYWLLSGLCIGYFLAMLSEGQVYVLNAGDSASLDCTFHADAYNLFDYPVLWRKTQRDEETQVCTDLHNIATLHLHHGLFAVIMERSAKHRPTTWAQLGSISISRIWSLLLLIAIAACLSSNASYDHLLHSHPLFKELRPIVKSKRNC